MSHWVTRVKKALAIAFKNNESPSAIAASSAA